MKKIAQIISVLIFTGLAFNIMLVRTAYADITKATIYKTENCGCCENHMDILKSQGFKFNVVNVENLQGINERFEIPEKFAGCHTITTDNYIIEGHVPTNAIKAMLTNKPNIVGISVPGMVMDSETRKVMVYSLIKNGTTKQFGEY